MRSINRTITSVSFISPSLPPAGELALNYQAEENSNVTVEWRFSNKTGISVPSLKIHCVFLSEEPQKVFYELDNSVKESQHEQFAGRVQCDKDALGTGRVRFHVFRVTTHDSGSYLCRMATEFGRKSEEFALNITGKLAQTSARICEGFV